MIRVYILLFQQFVYCCECEVEPWNKWTVVGSCGETKERRFRICSIKDGWTLGLICSEKDEQKIYEYRDKSLSPCRKNKG